MILEKVNMPIMTMSYDKTDNYHRIIKSAVMFAAFFRIYKIILETVLRKFNRYKQ